MQSNVPERRSMLSALATSVAAFALGSRSASAQAPAAGFQAARHPQDAWLDGVPGTHRTIIDASTLNGAGEAMLYANNLYVANKSGYQLEERNVAVVVCLRHFATPFAFNDVIWGKYGKAMSAMLNFTDPKTKAAPSTNVLASPDYGMTLSNFGNTIDSVVKRGTQFAVCDMATHFFAAEMAMQTGGNAEAVYKELVANTIPNSHMVAAGVLAVNRAQEHGYTLLTTL
jgi:intracellular sulfur oxidation DsrE/DsrF family protein